MNPRPPPDLETGAPRRGPPWLGELVVGMAVVLSIITAVKLVTSRGGEIALQLGAWNSSSRLLAAALPGNAEAPTGSARQSSVYEALEVFGGALMLIREQYLEPVEAEALMDGAVRGIFDALDPDSAYLSAEEADLYRNRAAVEGAIGIGLQKRYYLHVDDVLPGSPAAGAGIERGAAITAIDGRNTRDLRIPVARLLLSGPPGSAVELTVRNAADAEAAAVVLERAVLPPPPVDHRLLDERTGLLGIRRFHDRTPAQLFTAAATLRESGADALVLDLRGSRGLGVGCDAGVEAAAVFMDGVVARRAERGEDGIETSAPLEPPAEEPARDPVWSGPLAVVVGGSTVCPGEVLAAALSAREATDLVGRRTSGRTGDPQLIELPEGDAVLLSVAHFQDAEGEDILGVGVAPTLTAADLDLESGDLEADDPELDLARRALARRRAGAPTPS